MSPEPKPLCDPPPTSSQPLLGISACKPYCVCVSERLILIWLRLHQNWFTVVSHLDEADVTKPQETSESCQLGVRLASIPLTVHEDGQQRSEAETSGSLEAPSVGHVRVSNASTSTFKLFLQPPSF